MPVVDPDRPPLAKSYLIGYDFLMANTRTRKSERRATPREAADLLDLTLGSINKAIAQQLVRSRTAGHPKTRWLAEPELAALALLKDVDIGLPLATKKQLTGWVRKERPHQQPAPTQLTLRGGLTVEYRPAIKGFHEHVMRYLELRDQWIRSDSAIKGGLPVIAGTRISVYGVAERIATGDALDTLCEEYPSIPREAFETAIAYARSHPRRGRPRSHRPWRTPEG